MLPDRPQRAAFSRVWVARYSNRPRLYCGSRHVKFGQATARETTAGRAGFRGDGGICYLCLLFFVGEIDTRCAVLQYRTVLGRRSKMGKRDS